VQVKLELHGSSIGRKTSTSNAHTADPPTIDISSCFTETEVNELCREGPDFSRPSLHSILY
jgi:hypothetical protein